MVRAILEFKKRDFVWIVPLALVLVIGFGMSIGSENWQVHGHDAGELNVSGGGGFVPLDGRISLVSVSSGDANFGGYSSVQAIDLTNYIPSGLSPTHALVNVKLYAKYSTSNRAHPQKTSVLLGNSSVGLFSIMEEYGGETGAVYAWPNTPFISGNIETLVRIGADNKIYVQVDNSVGYSWSTSSLKVDLVGFF